MMLVRYSYGKVFLVSGNRLSVLSFLGFHIFFFFFLYFLVRKGDRLHHEMKAICCFKLEPLVVIFANNALIIFQTLYFG